jgi:hypothetical protein
MSPDLESLKIASLDRREYGSSEYIESLQTLHKFPHLKTLFVPRVALFNVSPNTNANIVGHTHPVEVLPSSLESLTIYDPYLSTLEWLGRILERREEVPNLEEIMFDFQHSPYSTIQGFDTSEKVPIIRFYEAGIRMRYRNANPNAIHRNPDCYHSYSDDEGDDDGDDASVNSWEADSDGDQ